MESEFLFTKIALPKGSQESKILCFAEFFAHEIKPKKTDFNFAQITIMLPSNLSQSPIYQTINITSTQCLNNDIEWTEEYFSKIRLAFKT